MIQEEYKNNVNEVSGNVVTTGFNIEVNESMFQMLTANVYNDPIMAVMREWSTNACDACLAADTEVKFDVHIPTTQEPTFFVRDYGTGLPPEDVIGVFSNLGASTKRGSNKFNGTLGIGRMAGLAVADAFTVESFYQGKKYAYVISMKNGIPVTLHLGDSSTSEPNGLKLSVAVEFSDIPHYVNKTRGLYKYFDYKPNLNIDIDITLSTEEHISDEWFVDNSRDALYTSRNKVVMSQVAYEIPLNSAIRDFGFKNMVIKVPPGSVTFNPGRESLSLNKQTIDFINKKFEDISEEYVQKANNAMVLANNDYELFKTYSTLVKAIPHTLVKAIDPSAYISKELKDMFATRTRGYYYSASSTPNPTYEYLTATQNFNAATLGLVTLHHKASYYKTSKVMDDDYYIAYSEFFKAKHVVVDVKTKFKTAISDYFSGSTVIMWVRTKGSDIENSVEQSKKYLKAMGIPFTLASDITSNVKVDEKSVTAPREGFYASVINGDQVHKSQKMTEYECGNQTYLYLKVKQSTPQLSDSAISFEDYQILYKLLSKIVHMPKVRGVPMKYQEYANTLTNWVDYETFIKDKIKQIVFKKSLENNMLAVATMLNDTTIQYFPDDLKDYYKEAEERKAFRADNKCIKDEPYKNLIEKIGGTFEEYTEKYTLDMDGLASKYKLTFPLFQGTIRAYSLENSFIYDLAQLEHNYAICKIGQ